MTENNPNFYIAHRKGHNKTITIHADIFAFDYGISLPDEGERESLKMRGENPESLTIMRDLFEKKDIKGLKNKANTNKITKAFFDTIMNELSLFEATAYDRYFERFKNIDIIYIISPSSQQTMFPKLIFFKVPYEMKVGWSSEGKKGKTTLVVIYDKNHKGWKGVEIQRLVFIIQIADLLIQGMDITKAEKKASEYYQKSQVTGPGGVAKKMPDMEGSSMKIMTNGEVILINKPIETTDADVGFFNNIEQSTITNPNFRFE